MPTNPRIEASGDKYVNSRLKARSTIDDLLSPDGCAMDEDTEKAELFDHFFPSVFTEEALSPVPEINFTSVPPLDDTTLSPEMVYNKLKELNPSLRVLMDGPLL